MQCECLPLRIRASGAGLDLEDAMNAPALACGYRRWESDGYVITVEAHAGEVRPFRALVCNEEGRVVGHTGFCRSHMNAHTAGVELARLDRVARS